MDVLNLLPQHTTLRGGDLVVERPLSSGGFGNTYMVRNRLDKVLAMKEFFMEKINLRTDGIVTVSVPDNKSTFESQKAKFEKEAKRLSEIPNKHIVSVYDLFYENGTVYYTMDFIDGESLADKIKRSGKPLPEKDVRIILDQVLDALDAVHSQGIFHLDLKPSNIMQDKHGNVILIDFGASKQVGSDNQKSILTSTSISYTPGYAPTEQVESNIKNIGPWTDFYALGATLYHLLTGKKPPQCSEMLEAEMDGNDGVSKLLALPKSISKEMAGLIGWMMKPNRKKRPQSVEDVRNFFKDDPDDPTIIIPPKPKPTKRSLYGIVRDKMRAKSGRLKRRDVLSLIIKFSQWFIMFLTCGYTCGAIYHWILDDIEGEGYSQTVNENDAVPFYYWNEFWACAFIVLCLFIISKTRRSTTLYPLWSRSIWDKYFFLYVVSIIVCKLILYFGAIEQLVPIEFVNADYPHYVWLIATIVFGGLFIFSFIKTFRHRLLYIRWMATAFVIILAIAPISYVFEQKCWKKSLKTQRWSKQAFVGYHDSYTYWRSCDEIDGNIIPYTRNGFWGLAKDGKVENLKGCFYDRIEQGNNVFWKVEKDGKWGLIDTLGIEVIQPNYSDIFISDYSDYGYYEISNSEIREFEYGGRRVCESDYTAYYGAISTDGENVIPMEYNSINICNHELWVVGKYKENFNYNQNTDSEGYSDSPTLYYGLVKTNGDIVLPVEYDSLELKEDNGHKYYEAKKDGKRYRISMDGNKQKIRTISYLQQEEDGKIKLIPTWSGK